MSGDGRGEFLFLGNDPALDFLNTRPVVDGEPVELLPDAAALARWLAAAGVVDENRRGWCAAGSGIFEGRRKKGTRQWCSMNLCGNRSKVAAYTQQQRERIEDRV